LVVPLRLRDQRHFLQIPRVAWTQNIAENRWLDPRCSVLDLLSNIDGTFIDLIDGRFMTMVDNRQTLANPIEGISVSDDNAKIWSGPRNIY